MGCFWGSTLGFCKQSLTLLSVILSCSFLVVYRKKTIILAAGWSERDVLEILEDFWELSML